MPGTDPKKVKKNPKMQSEDSLEHDYLAKRDFTVMELMRIFSSLPQEGPKLP